jgi:hypothetical protein
MDTVMDMTKRKDDITLKNKLHKIEIYKQPDKKISYRSHVPLNLLKIIEKGPINLND